MKKILILSLLGSLSTGTVFASESAWIAINTSSLIGTSGTVDFQFNPSNTPQVATAVMESFTTDGTLSGAATLTGDVARALPGNVTFDNQTSFNDYYQKFVFGSFIDFTVVFSGPAIDSPDGISLTSTDFYALLADSSGNPLLTNDPNGVLVDVGINLDGTLNPVSTSPDATFPTPEPASFGLLTLGFLAGGAVCRRMSR